MDNEKESGGWNMYKLDDLFDFDGDGELDSVERRIRLGVTKG